MAVIFIRLIQGGYIFLVFSTNATVYLQYCKKYTSLFVEYFFTVSVDSLFFIFQNTNLYEKYKKGAL